MKNIPVFDTSFFDINNQNSTLTFTDEKVDFKIVQPYSIEDDIGYKEDLATSELLEFRQLQILNKAKTNKFFNVFKSDKLNNKKYAYIKRVRSQQDKVNILICAYDEHTENELNDALKEKDLIIGVDYICLDTIAYIPKCPPLNKDINDLWSKKYWPMNWKGNLKENKLKQVFLNDYQLLRYSKFKSLFNLINNYKAENKLSIQDHVTLFYNTKTDESKIFKDTQLLKKFVLNHSIINGIDNICDNKNSDDYLLQDFFVITTHEPCQMCCMALMHSRIKLLLFENYSQKDVKMLSDDNFSLASYKPLNWEFQVLQYKFTHEV
ncbi:Tad3 protein [Hanseniaspora uvarum]|nr:Tad3 protein [Hanseniaspora uvarum]